MDADDAHGLHLVAMAPSDSMHSTLRQAHSSAMSLEEDGATADAPTDAPELPPPDGAASDGSADGAGDAAATLVFTPSTQAAAPNLPRTHKRHQNAPLKKAMSQYTEGGHD